MKRIKIINILLIINILCQVLSPTLSSIADEGETGNPKERVGYHLEYHNSGNWTAFGQDLTGCDDQTTDTNTSKCYHYLGKAIVTNGLYATSGDTVYSITVPCTDGTNWTITGERAYICYVGATPQLHVPKRSGYTYIANATCKRDTRLYRFVTSCPYCKDGINGKYLKGVMYYKWQNANDYGPDKASAVSPLYGRNNIRLQ